MIAALIINAAIITVMVMIIWGLRPFWRESRSLDLQYLAVGLSWIAGTAAARGVWQIAKVLTGADARMYFYVGTIIGGVYVLRSFREMVPADQRHRWPVIIAAFYPHHPGESHFADAIRRWWCRNQR